MRDALYLHWSHLTKGLIGVFLGFLTSSIALVCYKIAKKYSEAHFRSKKGQTEEIGVL